MATRLYFHAASNALGGTFPTGEQSAAATADYNATGANTLKTMNTTVGTAQTSVPATTLARTTNQIGFYGFFCSPPFASNQTVGATGQTITLNIACQESSLSANLWADLRTNIYIWRPSTGALIGRINDLGAMTGMAEPGAFNSERCNQGITTTSTGIAALTGDVLICEVWEQHSQATSIAYTSTFFFDGTVTTTVTNTVVSDHAAFLNFSVDTLTFQTISSGSFTQTLAAETLSASGKTLIQGGFSQTLAVETLSATGANPLKTGTFTQTLAPETLSASGKVLIQGGLNTSLATLALSADGTVIGSEGVNGTFSNSLADFTLAASANLLISGNFSQILAVESLSASGQVSINGGFSQTLANETLASSGNILITGGFAASLADETLSANGKVLVQAGFSSNLAAFTLSASGIVQSIVAGTFNNSLADLTLSASGSQTVTYQGTFDNTLAVFTLLSGGTVTDPVVSNGNFSTTLSSFSLQALGSQTIPSFSQQGGGGGGRDYGFIPSKSSNRSFKNLLDKEFKPKKVAIRNPVIQSISVSKPTIQLESLLSEDSDFMFILGALL